MKRTFFSVLLMLAFAFTAQAQTFSYNGLKQDVVIDVRAAAEFEADHIEGAINIPFDQIEAGIKEIKNLTSQSRIMLYCRSGRRAKIARNALLQQGFRQVINGGGLVQLSSQLKTCSTPQC